MLPSRRASSDRVRGEVRGAGRAAGDGGARSVQGRGLDCRFGAGHGEERTPNIWTMFVTLEVSKLSGWLNAGIFCRESKGGHTMLGEVRAGRQQAAGDRGACSAQGRGLDCRFGAGHGEERTKNMYCMSMTLEVSKLRGWLNALANCRESNGGNAVRGEGAGREAGRRRATAGHAACRGGLDCRYGTGHGERTVNM